jgi:hypothetical protein
VQQQARSKSYDTTEKGKHMPLIVPKAEPLNEFQKANIMAGFSELAHAVHQCAVDHGWWSDDKGLDTDRNMGEMIALMHSELSEALEAQRNSEPYLWYRNTSGNGTSAGPLNHDGTPAKPEGLASEFADTIIRILDTCEKLGIPLVRALIDKHNYNLSRPFRHGGKTS